MKYVDNTTEPNTTSIVKNLSTIIVTAAFIILLAVLITGYIKYRKK